MIISFALGGRWASARGAVDRILLAPCSTRSAEAHWYVQWIETKLHHIWLYIDFDDPIWKLKRKTEAALLSFRQQPNSWKLCMTLLNTETVDPLLVFFCASVFEVVSNIDSERCAYTSTVVTSFLSSFCRKHWHISGRYMMREPRKQSENLSLILY